MIIINFLGISWSFLYLIFLVDFCKTNKLYPRFLWEISYLVNENLKLILS